MPELGSLLEKREEVTVLDVRTPAEFSEGHIPGAMLAPLTSLSDFDTDLAHGKIVIYCETKVRSRKARDLLSKKGVTNIFLLEGGIDAWRRAGGNVVIGPYEELSDYPKAFEIPRNVCERNRPAMEVGK